MVFDASVLYPAPLRDLLIHLALSDLFRAKWTEEIHQEWIRNLLANRRDLTVEQLERTRDLMNRAVPDCLVEDYLPLLPHLTLPDPNDRHVLAAAIWARASVIVTYNRKDFPKSALRRYGVVALHPDDFIQGLLALDTPKVLEALRKQRQNLKHPPVTAEELLETLENQGLSRSVAMLVHYLAFL